MTNCSPNNGTGVHINQIFSFFFIFSSPLFLLQKARPNRAALFAVRKDGQPIRDWSWEDFDSPPGYRPKVTWVFYSLNRNHLLWKTKPQEVIFCLSPICVRRFSIWC